jgi:uncharacterized protein YjlB
MTEDIKKTFETLTGVYRPRLRDIRLRKRKPQTRRLKDDGKTPNNPHNPLLFYRSPVELDDDYDPAAVFETLFAANGWRDSWRDGMYDFNHFHTETHEVLGVARGNVIALFGGAKGRKIGLKTGDVVVIPAGIGHKRLRKSKDLLIVGAYPSNGGNYDEPRPQDVDPENARDSIRSVRLPARDPVYGKKGPLRRLWRLNRVHGKCGKPKQDQ